MPMRILVLLLLTFLGSASRASAFTREYLSIAEADPSLPKLGSDTVRLVAAYCP